MSQNKIHDDLDEKKMRLKRLENVRKSGVNPYPEKFDKQQSLAEAKAFKEGVVVQTAGRIMAIRDMGKIIFCHLQDMSGRLQVVLKEDETGKDKLKWFLDNFDLGDFLGVSGEIFTTKAGEVSVLVKKYELLSKTLLPLPDKWHGLKDTELAYRQRYLDLIANQDSFDRFKLRSEIVKSLREFYWSRGFIEVETPVLCNTASGAIAKPFITHHNALNTDVYLRIATEIYLKECVVGGFEKVFEIGRCFRNEGMDPSHLQDFTMIEHYAAYWNFEDNMKFTEDLVCHVLDNFFGGRKIKIKDRHGSLRDVDFTPPWPRVTFRDLIKQDCNIDIDKFDSADKLRAEIKKEKINLEDIEDLGRGNLIDALYKEVSRQKLIQPTFLIQHPLDLSPLARRNDSNPDIVDRFQLIVNTWELCNAYSELVDPIDQRERFKKQSQAKAHGDEEAHDKDDDFVKALEHGAPPISGWGMGVDRLVTLLTQQDNLRDVVLFPLMRPEGDSNDKGKGTKIVTIVLNNESGLASWQKMNAVAHLSASLACRQGRSLLKQDQIRTSDKHDLSLNIEQAIMIKSADSKKEIFKLMEEARQKDLVCHEFIEEMITTSSDKKIIESVGSKKFNQVNVLGVVIFGAKKDVDDLTKNYPLVQ